MNIENLALGYVKTAPSPATTGTSLTLETNEGARFPTTTTESFYVTLMPADENPNSDNSEVVEVTDRTGDVLTIVREQRGTTAQNVSVGWIVLNSVYKEDLENLPGSNSIYVETPTGDIDGENDEFTLSNIPTTIIGIFHNRTFLTETEDYTISEDVITLVDIPIVGDSLTAVYLTADTVSGNADTLDGFHADSTPTANQIPVLDESALLPIVAINPIHKLNAQEGFLINGKIVPSVASNNLTVAIKGLNGNDPSATNPVYIMLGGVLRSITSALSVTKNAGTNWCDSGGAKLATKEVDYFVYLGYNATDGVVIGFSRIPYARTYGTFSTTSTSEKYCAISTITNAAAGDNYTNIGRFGAILSAGTGYKWSVPTFTGINLIQKPIYESRILVCVPQVISGPVFSVAPLCFYQIRETMIHFNMSVSNFGVTGSGIALYSLPFSVMSNFYAGGASQYGSGIYIDPNGINFYKGINSEQWAGGEGGVYLYCEMFYPTALS